MLLSWALRGSECSPHTAGSAPRCSPVGRRDVAAAASVTAVPLWLQNPFSGLLIPKASPGAPGAQPAVINLLNCSSL